jgi:hypothetical protein
VVQRITSSKSDIVDLQYTEKRVGPRIEPCGTPIEVRGPDFNLGKKPIYKMILRTIF